MFTVLDLFTIGFISFLNGCISCALFYLLKHWRTKK